MFERLQQCLPLAVLKQVQKQKTKLDPLVATVLTACGIETAEVANQNIIKNIVELQQCLPLAVCDEGCEAAEERSDDEGRTSLVPD